MPNDIKIHEKYMRICFSLAKKGLGKTSPNPMVGCIVLDKNGKIIATGYHKKYGALHAERDALTKLKIGEATGGTLYVNLEPCSHYGKTPPCTDIIIEHGIKKVVYAISDPNPKVDGIKKLENAGIEVISGVLEEYAKFLNRIFLKNMTKKLPYVVLKTATTLDGKIATKTGKSKWITSDKSRKYVYKLRKLFDLIMTSSNTVLADNPKMEHKQKCILDKNWRTNNNFQIYKQGKVFVATTKNINYPLAIKTPLKNDKLDILFVLKELYKQGICSVFVECGGTLAGSMLKDGLIDEIHQFIAPKILNDNEGQSSFNGDICINISDCVNLETYEIKNLKPDILIKSIVIR